MIDQKPIYWQVLSCYSLYFTILSRDDRVIHLTFDREKHRRAFLFLQKMSPIVSLPQRVLPPEELLELLRKPPSFAELRSSPFIEQATLFQNRVWQLISEIEFGSVRTYGEIAEMLGNRGLARAVGRACNTNPIALSIPCHRVVGSSGLGGFSGGMEVKRKLLELEKNQTMSSIT
ncbi:MAG: MGMT family protein [Pseudomonadota bacterium]